MEKLPKKLNQYFILIENIKYNNVHGGAYAYIQYMAYTREIIKLLRSIKNTERFIESLEANNWLFNEYLAIKFNFSHQLIFENKWYETKDILNSIKKMFELKNTTLNHPSRSVHKQAA